MREPFPAVAALALFCAIPLPAKEGKPNIVFTLADDVAQGDLGCYGQKLIKTPCLDRMATEGTRYTQAYAGTSVCYFPPYLRNDDRKIELDGKTYAQNLSQKDVFDWVRKHKDNPLFLFYPVTWTTRTGRSRNARGKVNPAGRFKGVEKAFAVAPHTGTASFKTRSRIRFRNPSA